MIGYTLEITMEDGDGRHAVVVPITARAVVDFERKFKKGIVRAFAEDMMVEHQMWLAWRCLQLAGHVVKPFDEWLDVANPDSELQRKGGDPLPVGDTPI